MAESQGNSVPNFSSHDHTERRSGTHDRRNRLQLFPTLPIVNHALMNNTSSGHSDLMNVSALSRHPPTTHHQHTHNHQHSSSNHHHHHQHSNHHHSNHHSPHHHHQLQSPQQATSPHHHSHHHQSPQQATSPHHHSHHHHQSPQQATSPHHHSHHTHQSPQQATSRVDGGGGGGGGGGVVGGGGSEDPSWSRRSLPRVKPFSKQEIVWEKSREKFKFCQSIQSTGTLQVSPNDVAQDFTSGDLQDLGEIGRGAFGTVNKMVHRKSNTVMAVKRIRSTVDEKEQKQLLMDLEVVMKSNECPCIVQFYGALFKEGDCWICMELMDTSLDKFYKFIYEKLNLRIPETTLGKITVATVRALNYLKEKLKIIHRDVKPSNILLDRRGNIKLCDFGISGQLVDSIARTRDAGCRPYMAPERIDPQRARGYDVRSDVWSLGITLMEVATGRFPYPKWNSVFEQLYQVVQGEPPRLTTDQDLSGLSFSVDFVQFVNTCLIKDETQRPKYNKLLEHPFIRRSEAAQVDVAGYVSHTLDNMANYGQTMFTMNMP